MGILKGVCRETKASLRYTEPANVQHPGVAAMNARWRNVKQCPRLPRDAAHGVAYKYIKASPATTVGASAATNKASGSTACS